jgi:hypothetical protein
MIPTNRLAVLGALALAGCGGSNLRLTQGSSWEAYVQHRDGGPPRGDIAELRFKDGLCAGDALRPERQQLTENHLVDFLKNQHIDVRVERPRADLVYVVLTGAGTVSPVRLRVAILKDADEAGQELHEALLQHGTGAWGVHRSNLAVLGPAGSNADDLTFAAKTKLACWGVFTITGLDDTFVVPGGYTEI